MLRFLYFIISLILLILLYFILFFEDPKKEALDNVNSINQNSEFKAVHKKLTVKLFEQLKLDLDRRDISTAEIRFVLYYSEFFGSSISENDRKLFEHIINRKSDLNLMLYDEQVKAGDAVATEITLTIHSSNAYLLLEIYQVTGDEKFLTGAKATLSEIERLYLKIEDNLTISTRANIVSLYAKATQVLNNSKYKDSATEIAIYVSQNLYNSKNILGGPLTGFSHVRGEVPASLSDYIFLINALLDLYETTQDHSWFEFAKILQDFQNDKFWDKQQAVFNIPGSKIEVLLYQENVVALHNLVRFYYLNFNIEDERMYKSLRKSLIQKQAPEYNDQHLSFLQVLMFIDSPPKELALIEGEDGENFTLMQQLIFSTFMPYKVIATCHKGINCENLGIGLLARKKPINNKTTLFVCENNQCKLPISDINLLKNFIN